MSGSAKLGGRRNHATDVENAIPKKHNRKYTYAAVNCGSANAFNRSAIHHSEPRFKRAVGHIARVVFAFPFDFPAV
jgi:hypothetical protein